MEEKVTEIREGLPQSPEEELPAEGGATIPDLGQNDSPFVEVKFNKETRKLSLEEAATLAQMGLKFQTVEKEFSRLRALSKGKGLSVGDYLSEIERENTERELAALAEKCGGDRELAKRLLGAEKPAEEDDFAALKAEFPELTPDALPDTVKTAAQLKGTGLLFEYLLYEHHRRVAANEELSRREEMAEKLLGSLSSSTGQNNVDAEFLKGVWG